MAEDGLKVGLVLGGGGVLGGTWLAGALHAIASETSWDPGSSDCIVATCAGAMRAAGEARVKVDRRPCARAARSAARASLTRRPGGAARLRAPAARWHAAAVPVSHPPATEKPASSLDRSALASYVLHRQTPAGGYCYYRTPQWGVEEPNAPDTLAALRCLRLLAVAAPERERTVRWLRALQRPDGSYPTLTIGWAALRALELLDATPTRSALVWLRGRAGLLLARRGAREWCAALRDALHFVELVRACGGEIEADLRSAVAELLEAARDSSGGWAQPGADLQTSAQAVALQLAAGLGTRPDARTAAFVARCEDRALGLCFAPEAQMTSAASLWGGLELMRAIGRPPSYPRAVAASLTLLQHPDGGLAARHRGIATLQDTWLGLCADEVLGRTRADGP